MSCVCCQPAVAVGNVGQLAVDLLVSTLKMSRVGYMHTDCLIPMAGNNPYGTCKEDAEELHTPAEGYRVPLSHLCFSLVSHILIVLFFILSTVYTSKQLKLAVLQIRAPIIRVKIKSCTVYLLFLANIISAESLSALVPTEQIEEVQTAAGVLDQIQRLHQDRGPVQQPRLPARRPAAAGVLVFSHRRIVLPRPLATPDKSACLSQQPSEVPHDAVPAGTER